MYSINTLFLPLDGLISSEIVCCSLVGVVCNVLYLYHFVTYCTILYQGQEGSIDNDQNGWVRGWCCLMARLKSLCP